MTKTQQKHFNQMLVTLKTIANEYQTLLQMKRSATKDYGLEYEEALEMSYENIRESAKVATRGVRYINSNE